MAYIRKFYLNTKKDVDVISITHDLNTAISESGKESGLITVVIPYSGAGLVIMSNVEDFVDELKANLAIFASDAGKTKDRLKREKEISPIVQSIMLGRTLSIPFHEKKTQIDPYDEVFLIDLESKNSRREFIIQIISDDKDAADQSKQGQGTPLGMMG